MSSSVKLASDPRLPANPSPSVDYLTRQNIRLTEILRQHATAINDLGYLIDTLGSSLRNRNSEIQALKMRIEVLEQSQSQKPNLSNILQRIDSIEQLIG